MKKNIIIIGAGEAGQMVARQLGRDPFLKDRYHLCGFLDDTKTTTAESVPVLGPIAQAKHLILKLSISEAIIAIPSATKSQMQRIIESLSGAGVDIRIVPGIRQIIDGDVSWRQIREVHPEDLLGREEVGFNLDKIDPFYRGRTILITGAGGSIGSELVRQTLTLPAKKIIALGRGENSLHTLYTEFPDEKRLEIILSDIKDSASIQRHFLQSKPEIVFHAAAHKHVPFMEKFPEEAVKNNILGTYHVARACAASGVSRMILISTDKAVKPSSVMGMSKRIAECIVRSMNAALGQTRFSFVRFGNVLGSRGSVVPVFTHQIKMGGPVTVTHKDMERYFMLIPEAARLVIQSAAIDKGELFILDMGRPVKIYDLARQMIALSNRPEVPIQFTGIRPGEKLTEELFSRQENTGRTEFEKIFVAHSNDRLLTQTALKNLINELETLTASAEPAKLSAALERLCMDLEGD